MANYAIDGIDLLIWGLQVRELRGIYTIPERKAPAEIQRNMVSGITGLIGTNDFYIKEREIEIDCYMIVASIGAAITNMSNLQAILYAPGTRELTTTYSSESWTCYCRDGATTKRLSGVEGTQVVYQVVIKLIEINPRRILS